MNTLPLHYVTSLDKTLGPQRAFWHLVDVVEKLCDMDHMHGDDEVVYFMNKDSARWVEQHVWRKVYIVLRIEATISCHNFIWDNMKDMGAWQSVYCMGFLLSKLRLTNHHSSGCPTSPIFAIGVKLELPMYPNLKMAKQSKDMNSMQ